MNGKSINKLTEQLSSDIATQLLDLHQTAQRIVDQSGHVTCDEEVASALRTSFLTKKKSSLRERHHKGSNLGMC